MKGLTTAFLGLALVLAPALAWSQDGATGAANPARSMQAKLRHLETNAQARVPDSTPTVISEEEANAYLASGAVQLPKGVQRVRLEGLPGVIAAHLRVDFDQLTRGARSANPLLMLFSGVHDVQVAAHAHGDRGIGIVHVDAVSIDNVEVPRAALEFFVEHYLKPKYPEVGLDTRFRMPDRVDTAVVGEHKLTVVQK